MASTLLDIGQEAGCSPATVSRVLNNSGPVSQEVRDRVESVVREHGYVHQASKRSADSRNSRNVSSGSAVVLFYRPGPIEVLTKCADGVHVNPTKDVGEQEVLSTIHQMSNGFFHSVIDGLLEESNHFDVKTSIQACSHLDSVGWTQRIQDDCASCLLLVGPYRKEVEQFIAEFPSPVVLVGLNYSCQHDAITIDNSGGIRQALAHVVEQGHRDIGFVGVRGMPDFEERRHAFLAFMHDSGLPIREDWINLGTLQMAEIANRTAALLSQPERPTALVCGNDLTAIATIEGAKLCGIRVPDQLSITGFDDISAATLTSPPLTTVRVPMQQIGQQAVRHMVMRNSRGDDKHYVGCITRVATQLVVRQSTAAPLRDS